MTRRGSHVERWADAVSLLVKAPRTRSELSELTGMGEMAMFRVLHALKGEGLVLQLRDQKAGRPRGGVGADIWSWAP